VVDSVERKYMLEAFLESSGMDFWELVAQKTNLKSARYTAQPQNYSS
jgi:hypothetical protein